MNCTNFFPTSLAYGAMGGLVVGAAVGGPVGGAVGLMKMGGVFGLAERIACNTLDFVSRSLKHSIRPRTNGVCGFDIHLLKDGSGRWLTSDDIAEGVKKNAAWDRYDKKCEKIDLIGKIASAAFGVIAAIGVMLYFGSAPVSIPAAACTFTAVVFAPKIGKLVLSDMPNYLKSALYKA